MSQQCMRSGHGVTGLPLVQDEVQALRGVWGKEAKVAVNMQATPQQAKRLAANVRVVHFACHARADNTDPLGSALLLAPAGAPTGLLTAGDVLLGWRLRADVVMLPAVRRACAWRGGMGGVQARISDRLQVGL
ncbi:MAG: CHAT domain-containing protein [Fimbriimonadales bacterium]|nr:CHAT domain-containing protein [Fimbriimonadales bacterium]